MVSPDVAFKCVVFIYDVMIYNETGQNKSNQYHKWNPKPITKFPAGGVYQQIMIPHEAFGTC